MSTNLKPLNSMFKHHEEEVVKQSLAKKQAEEKALTEKKAQEKALADKKPQDKASADKKPELIEKKSNVSTPTQAKTAVKNDASLTQNK